MQKLLQSVPKYAKHRPSGQAVVYIEGKMFYLGPHGTKASKIAYDQLVMQWLASGRNLPPRQQSKALTVTELCVRYFE